MQTGLEWATAIGTVGSAASAVYFGAIRPWWRRPRLVIGESETFPAESQVGDVSGPATWLRLPVKNASRRDAAEDVEAILRSVKSGQSPDNLRDRHLGGFALHWTAVNTTAAHLPPGVTRYVNIGYGPLIAEPPQTFETFYLDLADPPRGDRSFWSDKCAEIEVVIAARNTEPVSHSITLPLASMLIPAPDQ